MKESKQPAPKSQTSKTEAVAPSEEKEGNLQNVTQREAEVQMFSCTMHPTAGEDRLWEWLQMCMLWVFRINILFNHRENCPERLELFLLS